MLLWDVTASWPVLCCTGGVEMKRSGGSGETMKCPSNGFLGEEEEQQQQGNEWEMLWWTLMVIHN